MSKMKKQINRFTILELLIVISIIAILAALMLPVLNSAREKGLSASCLSRLKQCGLEMEFYANSFGDYIPVVPPGNAGVGNCNSWGMTLLLANHPAKSVWAMESYTEFSCPAQARFEPVSYTTYYLQTYGVSLWLTGRWEESTYVLRNKIGIKASSRWLPQKQPSSTIILGDSFYPARKVQHSMLHRNESDLVLRHQNRVNSLMLDGHAAALNVGMLSIECNGKGMSIFSSDGTRINF